ncbi:MAG: hypothetical protein GY928_38600 [Colwellia sp.]|nr:hypothetical protein [Colwellia sp.]
MKQLKCRVLKSSLFLGLYVLLCLIIVPVFVHASELSKKEVRSAVQTWIRHVTTDARPDAVIEKMEPYVVGGEIFAYIVHLQGAGFCLAGANDLALPVYFYSPEGRYNPNNPGLQVILQEIDSITKGLRKASIEDAPIFQNNQNTLTERALYWEELIAGRIPGRMQAKMDSLAAPDAPGAISLDLNAKWNQGSPYNDQCPLLTPPDEHSFVGCNATALAQIMYYWGWPNTGIGSHSVNYNYRWRNNWDEEPLTFSGSILYV